MSISRLPAVALAAALALAGCNREAAQAPAKAPPPPPAAAPAPAPAQAPAALTGFFHQPGFDVFGSYLPKAKVQADGLFLRQIHVGSPEEFASYERGRRISRDDAPLVLEFGLVEPSSLSATEQTPASIRILPSAYRVTDQGVSFLGAHEALGPVSFEGRLDVAALERVRAGGAEEPVLRGTLTVKGHRIPAAFAWFGAD